MKCVICGVNETREPDRVCLPCQAGIPPVTEREILTKNQALEKRCEELAAALRLNLAVSPDDPRRALHREIEWESPWRTENGNRLRDELRAIAMLIEAHPVEFRALVNGIITETIDFMAEKKKRR
jgi:hypothetical protein